MVVKLTYSQVNGAVTYPAAGLLVMAIEAMRQISDHTRRPMGFQFRDVAIHKALIVPPTGSIEIQLTLLPSRVSNRNLLQWSNFQTCVYEKEVWTEVCSGETTVEYAKAPRDHERATEEDHVHWGIGQEYHAGSDVYTETVNAKDMYEHFAKLGISYGPSFATLKDIQYNNHGKTTASVNLSDWKRGSVAEPQHQEHVIHPAALDAIFQSVFAALTGGGTKSIPTLVPTKFRNIWIAADMHGSDDAEANIVTKANFVGFRNAESCIRATSAATGKPLVVGGYEMIFVSGNDRPMRSDDRSNPLCYYMHWKPDLTLMDFDQITDYCCSGVDDKLPGNRMEQEEEKRIACYIAMASSLAHPPSEDILLAKPYLKRYYDWLKYQMSKNSRPDVATAVEQWNSSGRDLDHVEGLLNRVKSYDAEGDVIFSVATNLAGILGGKVDGLSLLFSEQSLMEQYYRYDHRNKSTFLKVERYVDALAHKNSGLKVLEIGAGTGGATELILQTLMRQSAESGGSPRFEEYTYTDISPSFFEKARSKFQRAFGRMTFATLNIEEDPLEQGFKEAGYDLIIASHVS